MEIKGLYTRYGGKVHVHFGRKCITNLWDKYYEITDLSLINALKTTTRSRDPAAECSDLKKQIPDISQFGKLYVRTVTGTSPVSQPASRLDGATSDQVVTDDIPPAPAPAYADEIVAFRQNTVQQLMNFFSEFSFKPAARFVNTISRQKSAAAVAKYVSGYTRLINHPDSNNIVEKMKSAEWRTIAAALLKYPADKAINDRLVIYFGDAGTGKTTKAVTDNPEAPVIPCNAAMLPDELLRTFDFNDANGNPVFKPSTLRLCMESGKPIIFDEINLLSFDCLRLLQTITDRKNEIDFNGDTIAIKPGFKIIGTMNLVVNDQVYNLPEPLVDRAEKIEEFVLSAKDLTAYAFE